MVRGNKLALTFCEVAGHYVLVIIDDHSRFPEIEVVHSTSAKAVTSKLDRIFATCGVPQVVKSDSGPPFNGGEFAQSWLQPPKGVSSMARS